MEKFYVVVFLIAHFCFGWDHIGHRDISHDVIYHEPLVSLLRNTLSISSFRMQEIVAVAAAGDLPEYKEFHSGQWDNASNWASFRSYWSKIPISPTHIGVMLHQLEDVAVPVGHSPANKINIDAFREARFESIGVNSTCWDNPSSVVFSTSLVGAIENNKNQGKNFEQLFNELTIEFYNLTIKNATTFKTHFVKYPLGVDYHELRPGCRAAAEIFARELLYVYLQCTIHQCWDNPDLLFKKNDMTPINMLLLD